MVAVAAGVSACRAVATLQSNQLRGLVAASLSDYMAFFKQHKAVQQLDPQQDSCMWSCRPVFETELVAVQGGKQICQFMCCMVLHSAMFSMRVQGDAD